MLVWKACGPKPAVPSVVTHICNPNSDEAETGKFPILACLESCGPMRDSISKKKKINITSGVTFEVVVGTSTYTNIYTDTNVHTNECTHTKRSAEHKTDLAQDLSSKYNV